MSTQPEYTPPKVWTPPAASGGSFASINRAVAGPTHDKARPVGRHPLQLYSLATPNGVKVTLMLKDLLGMGHAGAAHGAHRDRSIESLQGHHDGRARRRPAQRDPRQIAQEGVVAADAVQAPASGQRTHQSPADPDHQQGQHEKEQRRDQPPGLVGQALLGSIDVASSSGHGWAAARGASGCQRWNAGRPGSWAWLDGGRQPTGIGR